MSNIKDVAKEAGVSISTVSYALNNSGSVSDKTRKKILDAAKKLGYKPNGIARSLKTKKTSMIGVFLNDFDGPIYSEIIRGVQEVTRSNNYEMIVAECMANENDVSHIFTQRIVDGAIILSTQISSKVVEEYASSDFPIVVLDRELEGEYISNILIDNKTACYQLVKYICDLGIQEVAVINGPKGTYDSEKRYEGTLQGIRDFGLIVKDNHFLVGNFTEHSGYECTLKILEDPKYPEVIICANDEMAIGAMKAIREKGLRIPEDISVTGFDDIELASYVTPQLTTIHRPACELGILAAHILFNSMKGNTRKFHQVLSSELVIRDSLKKKKE